MDSRRSSKISVKTIRSLVPVSRVLRPVFYLVIASYLAGCQSAGRSADVPGTAPLKSTEAEAVGQQYAIISFYLLTDGSVSDVRIEESSGSKNLDDAAIKWYSTPGKFRPIIKDGVPTAAWKTIKVSFNLKDKSAN